MSRVFMVASGLRFLLGLLQRVTIGEVGRGRRAIAAATECPYRRGAPGDDGGDGDGFATQYDGHDDRQDHHREERDKGDPLAVALPL